MFLSMEDGRGDRARTRDLRFWRPSLYQLSYTPAWTSILLDSLILMATSTPTFWQTFVGIGHNAPMRRALPLLLVVLVTGVVGCAEKQVVNVKRRPKLYRSIISLSPSTTEIILSDADSSAVKGRTQSCDWPPSMVNRVPIVAGVKPYYEVIQKIKPDLIVFDPTLYSKADIEKIKSSTGADTFEFHVDTLDEFIQRAQDLGTTVASEMRFNDYINRIITEKGAASGGKFSVTPKTAIIMPGPGNTGMIAGTDSFLADIVKISGGELVGPKGKLFVPLNAESLVSLNPDVIIVPGTKSDMSGYTTIMSDPRFASTTAIKSKRVGVVDSDTLLRQGQRIDVLIKAVHRLIAPPGN